jgi:signal transduction histidine kinase
MYLKSLKRLRHRTGFRLTVWYAGLYLLYTLVLGGLTYVLLASSLQQRDHQHIAMELHEMVEIYARSGVAGVQHGVDSYGQPSYYFVRLTGADRATLVLALPAYWVPSALQALDPGRVPATVVWDDIATPDDGNRLEVASLRLADGVVLQVGAMTQVRADVLKRFRASFALVLLPMLALGAAGVAVLAVRTMRPLQSLIRTVQSIAAGALETRVATRQTASEWDELGRLFNTMLDQIAVLIQGMHDALDNVAHELRTPVARLRASAEVALQQAEAHPVLYREALADCLEESERLLTMLRTLMDISEAETGMMPLALEPVQLATLLAEVVDLYRYVIDEHQLDVSTTALPTVWVSADPTRLRQVIANLLDNAIKYTPPGGQITLTACQKPTGVAVVVEDTGRGMTPDELGHIWDRLYRGDRSRSQRGLGLGLSLVKAVVQAHHGAVAVSSTPGKGSRFTVRFPKPSSSHP